MAWEFLVLLFTVVIANAGQSYFTTWRMTSGGFLRDLFHRENPLKQLARNSDITVDELTEIKNRIQLVESYVAKLPLTQQNSELFVTKVGEFIAQKFQEREDQSERRSRELTETAARIEHYGKVILTGIQSKK